MSVLIVDHEVVHYEVLGRGKPLLFLHSWVCSWRYWAATMQTLSTQFRAYAIDMWGYGDTAKVSQKYSLDQQVLLIENFLEQMGISNCSIIGHGLGALTALLYAVNNSEKVDRIIAVECPLVDSGVDERLITNSILELIEWLLPQKDDIGPIRLDGLKTDPKAKDAFFSSLAIEDWSAIWKKLTNPVVMVNGRNDPVVFVPQIGTLPLLSENAHWITFEQSGHFPMLDESSKFNRLLVDFLSLPSSESLHELQTKEEWKRRLR